MYKPNRIYFRRQEACDSLALDFSGMEASSVEQEEPGKGEPVEDTTRGKEPGRWGRELRERQERRGSTGEGGTQSQARQF
jgi:hypothetical protein